MKRRDKLANAIPIEVISIGQLRHSESTTSSHQPTEIANGEEPNGIKYRVHLSGSDWVVIVRHPEGRVIEERFQCSSKPVFGPDAADIHEAEKRLERIILNLNSEGDL